MKYLGCAADRSCAGAKASLFLSLLIDTFYLHHLGGFLMIGAKQIKKLAERKDILIIGEHGSGKRHLAH